MTDTGATGGPVKGGFFAKPTSRLAWWSVGLAAAVVVLGLASAAIFGRPAAEIPTGLQRFSQIVGPFISIGMIAAALSALVTGVIAVVKYHERSWVLWFLPILVGLYMVFLLVGELLFPH